MRATTIPADRAAPDHGAEGPRPDFSYKPALDGLRAVAVLSVIAYHFGADWAPGGFLGVDMFFVLSGYLITSLLVLEWGKSSTIDLVAFWARRARRLLPALLLVLFAIAIWANLTAHSDQLNGIRSDSIWTMLYGANWHLIDTSQSYFTMVREASPLRHTWSLAIEEQFYLVWPLIAFACLKLARGRRWLLATVCGIGIVGSTLWMTHLFDVTNRSRAYYGTDARAGQLMVGALLGLVLLRWSPRTRAHQLAVQAAGVVGAAVCLWFFLEVGDAESGMYRGGFLVFAFATAALIAAVVQTLPSWLGSPLRGGLSWRPVVWIGAISYGLYLWHWPIVVAITPDTLGRTGWQLSAVRLAMTFGCATFSYYVLEQPVRHGKWFRGKTGLALAAGAGLATAVVIVVGTAGGTAPPSFLVANPDKPVAQAAPTPTAPPRPVEAQLGVSRMLLLGDSVAGNIGASLGEVAAEHGVALTTIARPACGMTTAIPTTDDEPLFWSAPCAVKAESYQNDAVRDVAPDVVIWLSTWEGLDMQFPDGTKATFGTPEWDQLMFNEWEKTRARLEAGGARLVFLTLPRRADDVHPAGVFPDEAERRIHLNAMYREFAARHPNDVAVADLANIVCPQGSSCPGTEPDGTVIRPRDGDHFEGDGPTWLAPRLYPEIIRALQGLPTPADAASQAIPPGLGADISALVSNR